MGCADTPFNGGSAHPICVLELPKNEVDESSILSDVLLSQSSQLAASSFFLLIF